MSTLSWGLIGASDIAATRVIGAIRATGGRIAGVASGSLDRAKAFAAEHDLPFGTTDVAELLASDIDAVYVSSTNDRHFGQAMAALEAGRHVLCEKPLALTAQEAEQMVARAEGLGLVLAANHHLPGSPLHATVRRLVGEGAIGEVVSARVDHAVLLPERLRGWRLGQGVPGSGVILDITCHDASVLNPLLGRPRSVAAIAVQQASWNRGGQFDAVMTAIEYESPDGRPVLAQTHDSFTVAHNRTALAVHGSEGTIVVRDAMTQDTAGEVELCTAGGTRSVPVDCSEDLYQIVLRHFAAAVAGTGTPTATGADGLLALKVALAAEQAALTGRRTSID